MHGPIWKRCALAVTSGVVLVLVLVSPVSAQDRFSGDFFLGVPINFDSNLTITQEGHEELSFNAAWETKPFEQPLYWDIRLAYWPSPDRGWALDLMHNKLILSNPPPEVQSYSHTHGYNMLTIQRLWIVSGNLILAAAGVVISHPESTVRDRVFPEQDAGILGGYDLAGPVLGGGIGRRLRLSDTFYASLEGRLTWSHSSTPIQYGESSFASFALHLLGGAGFGF
jgi:hypothetical protein